MVRQNAVSRRGRQRRIQSVNVLGEAVWYKDSFHNYRLGLGVGSKTVR